MANERLGTKNVGLLLEQYRAERKRLIFQLNIVRDTIAKLNAITKSEETELKATGERPKRGRPRKLALIVEGNKADRQAKSARKKGRKKRISTGGYRLSPWDEMVIGTITKDGLQPKEHLLKRALAWAKTHDKKLTQEDVELKLTRVLQKLSGPRGILGTHRTGLRRGYHYGLKEWFFASTGALRPVHLDKLVIEPKG